MPRKNSFLTEASLTLPVISSAIRITCSISSDNFIGLQTTEEDNELYYGTAIGDVTVSFSGPFDAVDIKVDAITHAGTSLNIPINTTSDYVIDKGFINFDYVSQQDSTIQAEELEEAVKVASDSVAINEQILDPGHPDLALASDNLAVVIARHP